MDNLANGWARTLVNPGKVARTGLTDINSTFTTLINVTTAERFHLVKACDSGSDANVTAILNATMGDCHALAIACGSYVAGGSVAKSWSTNACFIKKQLSPGKRIMTPDLVVDPVAKKVTVPVPYLIDGQFSEDEASTYEDKCLHCIHCHFAQALAMGRPVKAMMLELVLASNGGALRPRFLALLGKLTKHHSVKLIVDEIFTGGRTGEMLLTLSTPREFLDQVAYVTMGKWPGLGLILASSKEYDAMADDDKINDYLPARGMTTTLDVTEAFICWNLVLENLHITESRRQLVIEKLGLKGSDCWGPGLMIYAPIRRTDLCKANKFRIVPQLNESKIDSIKKILEPAWSKEITHREIVACVGAWIACQSLDGPLESPLKSEKVCRHLINKVNEDYRQVGETAKPQDWLAEYVGPSRCNRTLQNEVGRKLLSGSLIERLMQSTQQRTTQWILTNHIINPLKSAEKTPVKKNQSSKHTTPLKPSNTKSGGESKKKIDI